MQAIGFALDCLPGLGGESLMLKMPYTLATGHGEIRQVLSKRLPPCSLALTVLGGVVWASGAETHYLALNLLSYASDHHGKTCPRV